MSEILTESFCERCGTRYTFESARPKIRLKGVKVLSRGLKNFVLSDDTTMDEAMAAARSETDRESTAHQLDAFHKTFSFCMSCRQYTCPNCWNEVEARCQSCAPLPELEIAPRSAAPELAPPAFPGLVPLAGSATIAEPASNGTNGQHHDDVAPETVAEPAAKATDQTAGLLSRFRPGQSLDEALAAFEREQTAPEPEPEAISEAAATLEPAAVVEVGAVTEAEAESTAAVEAVAEVESLAATEPEVVAIEAAAEVETIDDPTAIADLEAPVAPGAVAAAQPMDAAVGEAPPEEMIGDPTRAAIAAAGAFLADDDQLAASEPAVAEASTEIQAEPVEAAPVPAEPAATQPDVVEQPTWRITAPDLDTKPIGAPSGPEEPAPLPPAEPQWPVRPEWPSAPRASAGLPFLGRPAQPEGGIDSVWAASNQELVATRPVVATGRASSGIQPCVSCGLSLSANARFCRRCGTLQGA
jgi:hypothetical protein